jgi:hypothetical protein
MFPKKWECILMSVQCLCIKFISVLPTIERWRMFTKKFCYNSTHMFHDIEMIPKLTYHIGRAIAQAVSRRLPKAAVRIRARVRSCGICGGWSGTGAGFQFSFHRLFHIHHQFNITYFILIMFLYCYTVWMWATFRTYIFHLSSASQQHNKHQ